MQHQRRFEVTLRVGNPIGFCANNKQNVCRVMLEDAYVGRCYKRCFIVRILEITRMSSVVITNADLSAGGVVNIEFTAAVVIIGEWDVVPCVEIKIIERNVIGEMVQNSELSTPQAAKAVVTLLDLSGESKIITSLAVGQRIFARAIKATHTPMAEEISIVGSLLTCDHNTPLLRVEEKLTRGKLEGVWPVVDAIAREIKSRSAAKPEAVDFFETLLYSFAGAKTGAAKKREPVKTKSGWAGQQFGGLQGALPEGIASVDIIDTLQKLRPGKSDDDAAVPFDFSGLWLRPLSYARSSPLVARVDAKYAKSIENNEFLGTQTVVTVAPDVMLKTFLKTILEFVYAVNCMVETYSTTASLSDHLTVWKLMKAAQLPADLAERAPKLAEEEFDPTDIVAAE